MTAKAAVRLADLSPRQQRLVAALLAAEKKGAPAGATGTPQESHRDRTTTDRRPAA